LALRSDVSFVKNIKIINTPADKFVGS